MKNIYEDANNRSDMQNIGSGDFEKENIGAASVKDAMNQGKAAQQPMGSNPPQLQLTQEQITALLSQLLSNQQLPAVQPQPEPQSQPSQEPSSPMNSGKRIIYQSPDFDEPNEAKKAVQLPAKKEDEPKRLNFFDDDDIFDNEEISKESLKSVSKPNTTASRVRTTNLGRSFSVDEIEYSNSDLPDVSSAKVAAKRNVSENLMDKEFETEEESVVSLSTKREVKMPVKAEEKTDATAEKRAFVPSIEIEEVEIGSPAADSKKKISTAELIRRIVLGVSLFAMVVAAGVLIHEYVLHRQNLDVEDEAKNLIVDVVETTKVKKKDQKKDEKKTTADSEAATALTPEQQWAQVRAEFPNVIFPPNIQLKYARLYATNQDFVGFLSADGANLNLPIVQTNNDEDYMTKNFYGKSTKYGCPFVTHVNKIDNLDTNTVIFGHHMNDGTVFGALDNYKTLEGFKKAPVISFNTLYKDYQWKVIAAFITNAYEAEDNGYVFKYYFASLSSQERFAAYLNELAQRSLYDTGVDVLPTDKLLTLSTCSHEFNEARMVVVARLVRPGEGTDVDVEKVTVNSNPRYPQAYYTKKKQTNPYANAARWEVG
ncbi:MAG: class B sortase [Ruminococcus sp.]|nr:class B sortase [Ruminococcus sp.]